MSAYVNDVRLTFNKYNIARNKRKELYGPTLFDTAIDVGVITYKAGKNKIIDISNSFKKAQDAGKFEENLDKIRRLLAKNYNKHFRGKLAKFGDLFRTHNPENLESDIVRSEKAIAELEKEVSEEELLDQFKERLTEDNNKPLKEEKVSYNPQDLKDFAKMYYNSNAKDEIKSSLVNGDTYNEVVDKVEASSNLHYGPFRSGIAVFFETLKNAKPLSYEQMDVVMEDMEELDDINYEIEELQNRIKDLNAAKEKIEDKYELVDSKERVRKAYLEVLYDSDDLLVLQSTHADELGLDKEVLQINSDVTAREIERIEGEKVAAFDEYLAKDEVVEKEFLEDFKADIEKEFGYKDTLNNFNELESDDSAFEDFEEIMDDLNEEIVKKSEKSKRNMYTRNN